VTTEPAPATNATAACVTLRLDGEIVGRGAAMVDDALAIATRMAMQEFDRRAPVGRDALQDQARAAAVARLAVSLELAGAFQPIEPRTLAEADALIQPGLEGVAVLKGSSSHVMFPAAMLLSGNMGGDGLTALIATATEPGVAMRGVEAGEPPAIAARHGISYTRFPVTHLVQATADSTPGFTFRGGRVVEPGEITLAALNTLTDRLAANLVTRASADGPRYWVRGTYQPATGRYDDAARPRDAALLALALTEYAGWRGGGPDTLSARAVARGVLDTLTRPREGADAVWHDPAACALWELAAWRLMEVEPNGEPFDTAAITRIDAALVDAYTGKWNESLPVTDRGLVAAALAARAADAGRSDLPGVPEWKSQAEKALRSIYRDVPPGRLAPQAVWLRRAEDFLAGPSSPIPAATALRDLRDQLILHQVPPDSGPGFADMRGGIVFTAGGNPFPTWGTLPVACFLAESLRDARLTDAAEIMPQMVKLLATLRYTRQLVLDESASYATVDPAKALGGVRLAVWDWRQPPEATAWALILTVESAKAIEQAGRRLKP